MILKEAIERIIAELDKRFVNRGAKATCPFCGNQSFIMSEGYTHRNLSRERMQPVLGGTSIPSVTIICNNCGYLADFSLGVLNMMHDIPTRGQPATDMPLDGIRIVREVKEGG